MTAMTGFLFVFLVLAAKPEPSPDLIDRLPGRLTNAG